MSPERSGVNAAALVDWGVASRPLPGQTESGDHFVVKAVGAGGGGVLVAVIDGLGHGSEAAAAARAAAAVLERYGHETVEELFGRSHEALHGTRGVVMSLAYLDGARGSVTWGGVGNVEGVILYPGSSLRRPRTSLVTSGGIVGSALPRFQTQVIPLAPGATLIFASDGIKIGFADEASTDVTPQQLADQILARHAKSTDDAIVLVVRYEGPPVVSTP